MRFVLTLFVIGMLASGGRGVAGEYRPPIQPDFLMDREPGPEESHSSIYLNPKLFPLWKEVFAHSDSELHRQAAFAIARAHLQKLPGLDQFRPELLQVLKAEQTHPATRFAAARALIVLETREAAADLYAVSQKFGTNFRVLIEPALAEWKYEPIQSLWSERIKSADTPRRELVLAIDGLVHCQNRSALPDLLAIVKDSQRPVDLRLQAARGAATLSHGELESLADQLLARPSATMIDRMCAVTLIQSHRSTTAVKLQQRLALDDEPAVAAVALHSLFEHDPQLVLPVSEPCLASRDSHVRKVVIETYLKLATEDRLKTLTASLNDPHPVLRGIVRDGFFVHSQDSKFESLIREATISILRGDNWRGQEQACLLLAALDRKEIAPRLLELLKSDRDEVMIASAWALRVLAIPETAPDIVNRLREHTSTISNDRHGTTHQIVHLSEAVAVLKHRPAIDVLRAYVPKTDMYNPIARAGAIYAIGVIFQDQLAAPPSEPSDQNPLDRAADPLDLAKMSDVAVASQLAEQLMGRVLDGMGMPPEKPEVRRASAIALGRMQAKSYAPGLKKLIGPKASTDPVVLGMRWAIHRMTGELLPIIPATPTEATGWFLEPAVSPEAELTGKQESEGKPDN